MKERKPVRLSALGGRFSTALAWLTRGPVPPKGYCSPSKGIMKSSGNRGFTLLELIVTLAIGLIMAAVTFIALMPMFKENHVNAAYDTTLSVMRNYRTQSITESKRYILTFTTPGTITVQYWGVGSQNYIMFMPDGSSQDTLGNYNSGVVYLTRPGELYSSRAVSVFGTTGRVRGWRLVDQGGAKWVQQ